MVTEVTSTTIETEPAVKADLVRLRRLTGRIVGSVFYGTLLRTMRESKLKGPYGHGGRGEEVFSAQLHGMLAERLGAAGHNTLADALYDRLERQQAGIVRTQLASREPKL